jgi:hypothetical protein
MGDVPVRMPTFSRRGHQPPFEGTDGVLVLRRGRPYDPAWDLWRPIRRWPGVLLSALVTIGLLTAVAYHFEHKLSSAPKPVFTEQPHTALSSAYFPPVAQDSLKPQHFTGKADAYAVPFTSSGGLTTWTFKCQCVNNFNVVVRNAAGTIVAVPINVIGPARLAAVGNYPAGSYSMYVGADGPWSINFINEAGLPVVATPYTYLSSGTSILGPFSSAAHFISAGYSANLGQLFTVQVVDKNDNVIDNAVVTLRSSYRSVALANLPNPYYLIVNGAGLWLIKVT